MTPYTQDRELLHCTQLYIGHYVYPVSKHMLTPQLSTAVTSVSDLAQFFFFKRALHVLKTAVHPYFREGGMYIHRYTVKTCIMKIAHWPVMNR